MSTAEFALLISIASLVVSLTALMRDRHLVRARAVAFGSPTTNQNLSVTVMNSGKRAISVTHLTVRQPGMPGVSRCFRVNGGQARIEVGESATTNIVPGDPVYCWESGNPYRYEVYVQDALGKNYRAFFPHDSLASRFRRRLHKIISTLLQYIRF
jgi:hypothetical protein